MTLFQTYSDHVMCMLYRTSTGVWRAAGAPTPTRVLLHATSNIKRASLGYVLLSITSVAIYVASK